MSLAVCEDGHEQIVYDDYTNRRRSGCPLCEAMKENQELQKEKERLQETQ